MTRSAYRWVAVPACLVVLAVAIADRGAAQVGWEKHGAFQTCLDSEAKAWLQVRVELAVNDDPAAGDIDDDKVAGWATNALKGCASKAGGGDSASEQEFMRFMAHWRDHIFTAAEEIRRRGRPD